MVMIRVGSLVDVVIFVTSFIWLLSLWMSHLLISDSFIIAHALEIVKGFGYEFGAMLQKSQIFVVIGLALLLLVLAAMRRISDPISNNDSTRRSYGNRRLFLIP